MSGTPEEAAEAVVTVFLDGARQGDVAAASITTLSAMPRASTARGRAHAVSKASAAR
jgi:hypothetical protein